MRRHIRLIYLLRQFTMHCQNTTLHKQMLVLMRQWYAFMAVLEIHSKCQINQLMRAIRHFVLQIMVISLISAWHLVRNLHLELKISIISAPPLLQFSVSQWACPTSIKYLLSTWTIFFAMYHCFWSCENLELVLVGLRDRTLVASQRNWELEKPWQVIKN